ncbi:ABC-2 type transport system permease protein [Lachnospiraceae bacterium XBB1006]|nr:ABC-2 type transport system permease protein [Lachnospiraceae bacterium XBB1006]
MLKVLIKKQIGEVFKGYFYNAKKNQMRSKFAVALWILFFVAIMVGVLGGMFGYLAFNLCESFLAAKVGWLYFMIMSSIAIVLGAFGSVFNTYSGLYLAKDNDLLLSMPIPVNSVIASRLLNVYLLGTMYAATAIIPAVIVYWYVAGITVARVICGILLFLIISMIVLLLSCILGWVVAKISLKLKNKSMVTVLTSLAFIGGYYFLYFKASDLIHNVVINAVVYGEKIKGVAYGLYLFGRIGEGNILATLGFFTAAVALTVLTWMVLARSFLKIATATGKTARVKYVAKSVKEKSIFGALLAKEFGKFTSSANYMLNCGLGVLVIPACGVLLLVKGKAFLPVLDRIWSGYQDAAVVLIITGLCTLTSMIITAVPSVSLEGKSLWILQSMPIEPKTVLRVKATMQFLLSGLPMLFSCVCALLVVKADMSVKTLLIAMPLLYAALAAVFNTMIGVKMPLLNWTNELAPIKQSGAVLLSMIIGWGSSVALFGLYMWQGYKIGAAAYLGIWMIVMAGVTIGIFRWLDTKGAKLFASL